MAMSTWLFLAGICVIYVALGIGALVFVVLLGTGRSFQEALTLAFVLACPLMMIGMMFMMRGGNGQQLGNDATDHRHSDHDAMPKV